TSGDCLLFSTAVLDYPVGVCGDGLITGGEPCDDADTMNGDGCSSTCSVESGWACPGGAPSVCTPVCGDGAVVGPEACDDGNASSADGCSSTCTVESGWTCPGGGGACSPIC